LKNPNDLEARGAMLLGAHFGGLAVENSMLGAAHACASPLQAHYDVAHGVAVALMLPHVVRWNRAAAGESYDDLHSGDLERRLRDLAELASLPSSLREAGIPAEALPRLADEAAAQWTGRFNPRPLNAAGALEIYERAMG
jgi:alcohol dehydrogenase